MSAHRLSKAECGYRTALAARCTASRPCRSEPALDDDVRYLRKAGLGRIFPRERSRGKWSNEALPRRDPWPSGSQPVFPFRRVLLLTRQNPGGDVVHAATLSSHPETDGSATRKRASTFRLATGGITRFRPETGGITRPARQRADRTRRGNAVHGAPAVPEQRSLGVTPSRERTWGSPLSQFVLEN